MTTHGTTAIYVRTSREDNDGTAQRHELGKVCAARWNLHEETGDLSAYVDLGESGAKASRPALDRLRSDVRAGKVRRIVVTELSRLGRQLGPLLVLLDDWHRAGCEVVVLREGIDYSTPLGRLLAQVLGAFAEFERGRISERIASGVQRARDRGSKSGKAIGRPACEFDVARAMALRAGGMSWRSMAQALGVKAPTLRRRLTETRRVLDAWPGRAE